MELLGQWSVAIEAAITFALAILILLRARDNTSWTLGILWFLLAVFNVSLLIWPDAPRWRGWGSYMVYITAMAWIGFRGRQHSNQAAAKHR
jgi:hypothetical protein